MKHPIKRFVRENVKKKINKKNRLCRSLLDAYKHSDGILHTLTVTYFLQVLILTPGIHRFIKKSRHRRRIRSQWPSRIWRNKMAARTPRALVFFSPVSLLIYSAARWSPLRDDNNNNNNMSSCWTLRYRREPEWDVTRVWQYTQIPKGKKSSLTRARIPLQNFTRIVLF